ncbi:MAG: thioredoxin domain-containing protein [Acidobacteriota bacterium]
MRNLEITNGWNGLMVVLAALGVTTGCDRFGASTAWTAPAGDVQTISKGEAVQLEEHLVDGKFTLFDFYADWCTICREIGPQLDQIAGEYDWVAIRKIDVVDWSSDVARQFELTSLPYMVLYDPGGTMVASGDDALNRLRQATRAGDPPLLEGTGKDHLKDPDLKSAVRESPDEPS